MMVRCACSVCSELQVLSLSRWRNVGLPSEVWQESWPNLNKITKDK